MGKQLRFYRTSEIEREIFAECKRIGLRRFEQTGDLVYAFSPPPDDWMTADVIQYSHGHGTDNFQGRLWSGSSDTDFLRVFERLRGFIRSRGTFHKVSGLWIWNAYRARFERYFADKQRDLQKVVAENTEYALTELGAKVVPKDDD